MLRYSITWSMADEVFEQSTGHAGAYIMADMIRTAPAEVEENDGMC